MKLSHFCLTSTILLSLSACSSTPDRRGPPPDQQARGGGQQVSGVFVKPIALLFVAMDSNQDGAVLGNELADGINTEWSRLKSLSGTSGLSGAYFSEWSKTSLGSTDAFPTFMSFDGDLNGVVTELEFSDRMRQEFSNLDKNKNGKVTRDEMLIVIEAPRGRQDGRRSGGQEGRGGGRGGGGERGGGRPPR